MIITQNKLAAQQDLQNLHQSLPSSQSSILDPQTTNKSADQLSKSNIVENTCEDQMIINHPESISTKTRIKSLEENKLCRENNLEQKTPKAIPIAINISRDRPIYCVGVCIIENNASSQGPIEIPVECEKMSVTKYQALSEQQEVTVIEEDLQNHPESQDHSQPQSPSA